MILSGSALAQDQAVPDAMEKSGPTMRRLVQLGVRGLPILVAGLIAGLAVGYAALALLPPRYTSSVSILIDPKRPDTLGADESFANLFVDSARVASVEQILVSSSLLGRVVATEHLADDPSMVRRPGLLRRLSSAIFNQDLPPPDSSAAARTEMAVEKLAKSIRTMRVGLTYVIKVDVTANQPARAQRLAADIADAYLADQLDGKYAAARHDVAWLNTRLQSLRQAVMDSESHVEAIRQQYGLVQTDGAPGSTLDRQSVSSLNAELSEARAEVATTGAKYNQVLAVQHRHGSLEGLPAVVSSKVIEDLRTQQAAANRHLADLLRRYTAEYQEVKQAKADRDTLNAQVAMEVSRIVSGLQNDYETAVTRRDELQSQIKQLVGATTTVNSSQARVALREAERLNDANRLAYEASLNRLRDVEQQETRQEAEARVISKPQLPEAPSFPIPALFLGGGGGLGLLGGFCLLFIRPRLQSQLSDPEDTRNFLRLPILAMAPALGKAELRGDNGKMSIPEYLLARPISQYAESLRVLRLALQNGLDGGNVFQVTSSVPGEGKSTLAASIAVSAANVGKRTILVDLDLYNPAVGRMFGGQQTEGIVEAVLSGDASRFVTRVHETLPLYVIAAGTQSKPRPDVIENSRLGTMIGDLARDFDVVILDTPPVLAISDPIRIAALCHATIMVVAWCDTQREMVEQAVQALRTAQAPLIGVVMNKVDLTKTGMYGGKTYTYKPYSSS
jgi:capsular exopolysaccharide synthesis family protein